MTKVSGLILAAGQSRRMGAENKLTKPWRGKPLLRHCVDAALESALSEILIVTGHQADEVKSILPSELSTIHNPLSEQGMATSLAVGIKQLDDDAAVMILLGDMPLVNSINIDALIDVYAGNDDPAKIVVATSNGKWGNPVIFPPKYRDALLQLSGDRGARSLLRENELHLSLVEIGIAAQRDFDDANSFADNQVE